MFVIQAVCCFFEERELALAGEFLYRSFTACSRDLVGQVFKIYGQQRSASSRVLGAFAAAVRGKALFEVIRPAGIERAVFAFEDVDTWAAIADSLFGRFRMIYMLPGSGLSTSGAFGVPGVLGVLGALCSGSNFRSLLFRVFDLVRAV